MDSLGSNQGIVPPSRKREEQRLVRKKGGKAKAHLLVDSSEAETEHEKSWSFILVQGRVATYLALPLYLG